MEVRHGFERIIFEDICSKIPQLLQNETKLLDIGCGSSTLTNIFIENAKVLNQNLFLLDSAEMLRKYEGKENLLKGKFPNEFNDFLAKNTLQFDGIIAYSVAHYVYKENELFDFVEKALSLLKPLGVLLLGDVPNLDKRERFFKTEEGINLHLNYLKKNQLPLDTLVAQPVDNIPEMELVKLMDYYQNKGFKVLFSKQNTQLPMHNRRDDILFIKQ